MDGRRAQVLRHVDNGAGTIGEREGAKENEMRRKLRGRYAPEDVVWGR